MGKGNDFQFRTITCILPTISPPIVGWPMCRKKQSPSEDMYVLRGALLTKNGIPLVTMDGRPLTLKVTDL